MSALEKSSKVFNGNTIFLSVSKLLNHASTLLLIWPKPMNVSIISYYSARIDKLTVEDLARLKVLHRTMLSPSPRSPPSPPHPFQLHATFTTCSHTNAMEIALFWPVRNWMTSCCEGGESFSSSSVVVGISSTSKEWHCSVLLR